MLVEKTESDSKAGDDAHLCAAEAGSGRLLSAERSKSEKLSDRDRIPPPPQFGKNRTLFLFYVSDYFEFQSSSNLWKENGIFMRKLIKL
jgi:hypothetical protein